jgi:ComF family protein
MNIGSQLAGAFKPLVDLVYPPRCPLCGGAVARQGGLCAECWGALAFPGEPCCTTCQRPMTPRSQARSEQCDACAQHPPLHTRVTAATLYNDTSRQLVLNLKHGHKIALAGLMGRLMAARLGVPAADQALPLLVPVPLHRWRLWDRGFNQAALLAREIAQAGKGEMLVDGLVRTRRTPSLGGLGRDEREAVLAGAITVPRQRVEAIRGRRVVLVDDVLTSGATTRACVAALIAAGAASVEIACFARVVAGPEFVPGGGQTGW